MSTISTISSIDQPDRRPPALARSPLQIIDGLGLGDAIDVNAMTGRTCAFKAVHMGERDLAIGTLLDLITSDAALCPPRTGHIGNWGNIARGRAGTMDFNKAICAPGYGYPLLYCFTQTEAEIPRQGDWGYLPGSLVDRDERTQLRLYAWDGVEFALTSRERPLFTPFVQAEVDGGLVPLIELHARRMHSIGGFDFRLEQAIIAEHGATIQPMLTVLFEDARRRDNQRRALQDLVSHAVALDGTVTRSEISASGNGYKLGECYYPSTEALVEHAMFPFQAVAKPTQFMREMSKLPWQLPVLSNQLIAILSAALQTHYPASIQPTNRSTGPFNPHLHWGGRDMAGYPPRRKGYLLEDSKVRSMRRICATLTESFSDCQPICFVLLPASVFMLCPASVHPLDAELLCALFRQVNAIPDRAAGNGIVGMQQAIENATRTWYEASGQLLSPYFRDRFGPRHGGLAQGNLPLESEPIEPQGFFGLTLQKASMVVGAMFELNAGHLA